VTAIIKHLSALHTDLGLPA